MAEDQETRTEPATARKRDEERNKGNVARSQDLNTSVILLSALLLLYFFGDAIRASMTDSVRVLLGSMGTAELTLGNLRGGVNSGGLRLMLGMAPLMIGLFLVAILVNLSQVGFILTGEPMSPKPEKLNPITGMKKFFTKRSLVKLLGSLFKLLGISVVLYVTVTEMSDRVFPLMGSDASEIFAFIASASFTVGIRMALVLLILSLFDLVYQRWQYEQEIKMTKQEVKDELKRAEGDPKTRERRIRAQRDIARQRMMHQVPEADVVITNPTHLACAIRYDAETMGAPILLAKGAGFIAQRIREIAAEHGIPIIEKKPLAQALFKSVEIGGPIPLDMYQAVAEILAYVYQLDGQAAKTRLEETVNG